MNYALPPALEASCLKLLHADTLLQVSFVGGGDINEARLLETSNAKFFLKMNEGTISLRMFETEVKGLELLSSIQVIRVPEVIGYGLAENKAFLLLEYIQPGYRRDVFWEKFGHALAAMHRSSNEKFGLENDNFIGSLPQSNRRHNTWPEFYITERLEPQFKLALDSGKLFSSDRTSFDQLYNKLADICPEEVPALIHGDLWSGNFLVSSESEPVLIDPSVSYAHREMDLAMSRLFGGFDRNFYRSYEEAFPLKPGFEQRLPVYQLYYLLVHVNLFGGAYVGSVRGILNQFI